MAMRTTIAAVGAVAATAVIGGVAADPGSAWYRSLRKPRWQPPPRAYALVWTPLYVTIAYAGVRALTRALSRDRSQLPVACSLTWRSTLPGLHCSSAPAGLAPR
jgi:translocator protein